MSANSEAQGSGRSADIFKWIIVCALLIIAIVGSITSVNIISRCVLCSCGCCRYCRCCRFMDHKGKATLAFAREARVEMRKVIWPTRQETLQTTLIVAAVTAVMSLILWGLDGILVRLVSFITSLRLF